MKIKLYGSESKKYLIRPGVFDISKSTLLNLGADVKSDKFVDILNRINNQGISEVNMKTLTYTVKGRVQALASLCTAEELFFYSILARETRLDLGIYRYDTQLTIPVLKMYYAEFKDVDSLTLYTDNKYTVPWMVGGDLCLI